MATVTTDLSPSKILYSLEKNQFSKEYQYIILGRTGPTGKTWLYERLKERDYSVTELSEDINSFVLYRDFDNHIDIDHLNKRVTIVLNKAIER